MSQRAPHTPPKRGRPRKVSAPELAIATAGVPDAPPSEAVPAAASSAVVPVIRNEGQRLLLGVPQSLQQVADVLGLGSKQSVAAWRKGEYVPEDRYRRALEAQYGIPFAAWGTSAAGTDEGDTDDDDTEHDPDADYKLLLRSLRRQLRGAGLTARERAQLTDAFSRALAAKARLAQQRELLEDRTIRDHAKWKRLRDAIIAALIKHPAAARDVEAEIRRLLGEDEAATEPARRTADAYAYTDD